MSNVYPNNFYPQNDVVIIKNGYKSYLKTQVVLNDFSMRISQGSLYALIGSSGCGKTTIINCILGLSKLDTGEISVFGKTPGSSPNKIGFMPQELSLYSEMTILETLKYFGWLNQVKCIENSIAFLENILTFHNTSISLSSTLVCNLSGGEQKQVSLAVALISKPTFVILDEPTSGMDPLLRERIWKFLINLVEVQNVTILLTTHYTDEVRKANIVGILRTGKLIAEEKPDTLLEKYRTQSLDQVILQVYKQPELTRYQSETIKNPPTHRISVKGNIGKRAKKQTISSQRTKALMWKNWITMLRQKGLFLFITVMPAIISLITCTTYRNGPKEIPLGIVNLDFDDQYICTNVQEVKNSYILECVGEPLSCRFLEELFPKFSGNGNVIRGKMFPSMESAREAVRKGETWGTLWFPRNFTESLTYRMLSDGLIAWTYEKNSEIWNSSQIYIQMDQTNQLIYSAVITEVHRILEQFFGNLSRDCGLSETFGEYPLQYINPPLVGSSRLGIIDYVAPGFTFGWLFFFPLISTSVRFIMEKKQGTYIRSLTSGTQIWEIFLANFVTELAVILLQSVSVLCILVYVFQLGSTDDTIFSVGIFLTWMIFVMGGVSGFCCGFLLGLVCGQEIEAALLSIAIFFPNAFVSGIVWPVEGMPLVLRWISPVLPFTLPNESLRSLLNRGWELTHPMVWPGFAVIIIFVMIYLSLIAILVKRMSRK